MASTFGEFGGSEASSKRHKQRGTYLVDDALALLEAVYNAIQSFDKNALRIHGEAAV